MSDFDETTELENQVREMAQLTLLSNKINPIQEKNLKMYPMVYFNGVKKVTIKYDLSSRKSETDAPAQNMSFVVYDLEIDESQDNSKLDLRFEHLERAVRNLFWNDIRIRLRFNGKLAKESEKHVK